MKNFRLYALCAAVLLFSASLRAQDMQLGVKSGFAAGWLTNTVLSSNDKVMPHNSFYAGLFANCDLADDIMFQTELIYTGRGHTDRNWENVGYKRNLMYLQVPLFIGYKIADKNCTIMAGPELGYLVHSSKKVDKHKTDTTPECNRFNLALAVQSTYMVEDCLGVELKFEWGLSRTFKPGMYGELINDNGRNVALQLGICYKFD
ncbi:MAG: porin family protein [Bacteroidia bacterium]|nr:porin family protein [Bacteroidia bacterium]